MFIEERNRIFNISNGKKARMILKRLTEIGFSDKILKKIENTDILVKFIKEFNPIHEITEEGEFVSIMNIRILKYKESDIINTEHGSMFISLKSFPLPCVFNEEEINKIKEFNVFIGGNV